MKDAENIGGEKMTLIYKNKKGDRWSLWLDFSWRLEARPGRGEIVFPRS